VQGAYPASQGGSAVVGLPLLASRAPAAQSL